MCFFVSACVNEKTSTTDNIFSPNAKIVKNIVSFKQGNQPICSWTNNEKMYKIAIIEGSYASTINNENFNIKDWSKLFSSKEIYSVINYKENLVSPYILGKEMKEGDESRTIEFVLNTSYTVYIMNSHLSKPHYSAVNIIGAGRKFYLHY